MSLDAGKQKQGGRKRWQAAKEIKVDRDRKRQEKGRNGRRVALIRTQALGRAEKVQDE